MKCPHCGFELEDDYEEKPPLFRNTMRLLEMQHEKELAKYS